LEPQAEAASLRLRVQIVDALPAVVCDRERVLQVIANLVGNAVKFTGPGGEICIAARPEGADAVCVCVSDTGSGIPEQQLAQVFDRHWTSRKGGDGTGLGLFIAKGIVEAQGGKIWVESNVGVGSSFFFTVPTARRGERQLPEPIAARP
jgi:signal transduction histidine kinase